jgi:hypothetical protein
MWKKKKTKTNTHIIDPQIDQAISELVVDDDGSKRWYNGKDQLHRINGPARELVNGTKEWYLNGKLHRDNGPSVEGAAGHKEWRLHGQLHRVNGPAVEYTDGTKVWWLHNQRHREDGPAIEWADGTKEWWLNGAPCRCEDIIVANTKQWTFPNLIELRYTEIELESLPEVFEDTQALYFPEGGTAYDLDGWLHLEGAFKGYELESLLAVIVPCIKTPVSLNIKDLDTHKEQTLEFASTGLYDQSGQEISLTLATRLFNISKY